MAITSDVDVMTSMITELQFGEQANIFLNVLLHKARAYLGGFPGLTPPPPMNPFLLKKPKNV